MITGSGPSISSLEAGIANLARLPSGTALVQHQAAVPASSFTTEAYVPSLGLAQSGLIPAAAAGSVRFAELVMGTEPMPIDYDVGLLSMDVGLDESAGPDDLNGWQRVTGFPDGEHPPPPFSLDPETGIITDQNGTRAALYQRGEPPQYVMVYAGTGDAKDMITDGVLFAGMVPGQTIFVMDLAEWIVDLYPGQVIFGGHSLGGSHASVSAMVTGAPAITFNSAGVNQSILDYVASVRNLSDPGGEWTGEKLLDEAANGQVRSHRVEGDGLTTVQEDDRLPSGALTVAVGHPIESERLDGISWPLGNHLMGSALNATGAGTMVVAVDGNTVQIAYPRPRNEIISVTFDDSAAGRKAQDHYQITGELPEDMSGVAEVSVIPFEVVGQQGHMGPMVTVTYDGNGTRTGEVVEFPGLKVISDIDDAGAENEDARVYQFTVTPGSATEAAQLNILFGHDPHHGPFKEGEPSTVVLTHAEMQEVKRDLPGRDGQSWHHDDTINAAITLVNTPGSSLLEQLWNARRRDSGVVEPIDAETVAADP